MNSGGASPDRPHVKNAMALQRSECHRQPPLLREREGERDQEIWDVTTFFRHNSQVPSSALLTPTVVHPIQTADYLVNPEVLISSDAYIAF